MSRLFEYFAYGLRVRSALPFEELEAVPRPGRADVEIRVSALPFPQRVLAGVRRSGSYFFSDNADTSYLYWKNDCRIRVRGGHRIGVFSEPGADPKGFRLSILGPAFSFLLAQRGRLVLHASAVKIGGKAVVFAGSSGAGKSTIAAALCAAGHELVTDNNLCVKFRGGRPYAVPSFPQLKLGPNSLALLGKRGSDFPLLHSSTLKRSVLVRDRFARQELPLGKIFFLSSRGEPGPRDLAPREALLELVRHSFAVPQRGRPRCLSRHFTQCLAIASKVPARHLRREGDLASIARMVKNAELES